MHDAWSAARGNGGQTVDARPVGRQGDEHLPAVVERRRRSRPGPPASAAVTQGIVPSSRYRPGPASTTRIACAPSRREVVRCEIPTVATASPSPMARSQRSAVGLSGRRQQPADAASCCERMKTAVRLPPASRA